MPADPDNIAPRSETPTEVLEAHVCLLSALLGRHPLETQVRMISGALDLPPDDLTAAVTSEVVRLVRAGEQIKAMRLLRKQTGLGLVETKRVVDAVSRG